MTTLNLQVTAGADDARERGDDTAFGSTNTSLPVDSNTTIGSRWNVGARFQNVTIAAGSTINTAVPKPYVTDTKFDDVNCDMYMNDVDNAANFSTEADVTSRARTTASTAWVADSLGTGEKNAPDIASAVQEVIDRGSWASGNALCLIFVGRGDVNKSLALRSYEGNSAQAPKLDIDYTAGGGGGGDPEGRLVGGKLLRGGLLRGGVL